MSAKDMLLATSKSLGDGRYKRTCWMCEDGELHIFVDAADGKVKLDHSEPSCVGWVVSGILADEYLHGARKANG